MTDNFKAPNLMRGNVKTAMKDIEATSADLWNVKPSSIKFMENFNLRVDNAEYRQHIENIVQSIMANGYYQDKPVAGFVALSDDGASQVVFCTEGHTRVLAALEAIKRGAALETIPMVIKPKGTTMEDLTIAMVTSNEGRPFSPYEKGLAIKRLMDMGLDEAAISKRLGFTRQYIDGLLTVVGAPKPIRDMVMSGQVAASTAATVIREHGGKATEKLQEAVKTAKAAGKTKASKKHLQKAPTLKLKGIVTRDTAEGGGKLAITLDQYTDVMIPAGSRVRLVISEPDDEL